MNSCFYTPPQVASRLLASGEKKADLSFFKTVLLGIAAGAFIALGGAASNVAMHGISDVGLSRLVAGAVFPVGLMLVVFTGSELFTGNCLMIVPVLDKKIKVYSMIKNLVTVFFSNLVGALFIDCLLALSGQFDYSDGGLGAFAIKVAVAKTSISPIEAVVSGALCNILVCSAIIMASASAGAAGKILSIFFPICAFVVCGFEHSVADMFYIPSGIIASFNQDYVQKAEELYGITASQCSSIASLRGLESILFVTIGNLVGGIVLVGLPVYLAYVRKGKIRI